jgi:mono/diheme cytochrome c family protein
MSTQSYLPTCLLLVMLPVTSLADETSGVPTVGEKLFALNVKALLAQKCNACHGDDPDKVEGDFNMLSRDAMLVGGEAYAGKVLIPGKGKESFLYQVTTRSVEGYEMPPKEAERLTEEQSRWIRDWINADAPWPDDKRVAEIQQAYAEGEIVATSGGLGDAWTNRRYKTEHLWAYRLLQLEAVPDGAHPVDWFINPVSSRDG